MCTTEPVGKRCIKHFIVYYTGGTGFREHEGTDVVYRLLHNSIQGPLSEDLHLPPDLQPA